MMFKGYNHGVKTSMRIIIYIALIIILIIMVIIMVIYSLLTGTAPPSMECSNNSCGYSGGYDIYGECMDTTGASMS